jgi:Tol biopolymer transport system component
VVSWLAVLLLLLITTACSGHITLPPLPVLDQPGVTPVPGFDRFLHNLPGYDKERLEQLTAYPPHDATQPAHALMVIGGGLYDIGLDGATAQKVAMQYACQDRPAVTDDGQWLLCAHEPGVVALDLEMPAPNDWQMALSNRPHTALSNRDNPQRAAWGPDNRHFAVDMDSADGCILGLYVADTPFKEAQLVTQLTFSSLAPDCDIEDVGWSPDGQWLAFIAQLPFGAGAKNELFALDLRAFPLPQDAATDANSTIAVPASALNDLGGAGETLT